MKSGKATYDPQTDKKGPFTLAALAEIKPEPGKEAKGKTTPKPAKKEGEEKKPYLVVFGDVDFATNAYFNLSGNGDLFLNTVNVLKGWQGWFLFLTCLVALPLIMLAAGVRAYLRRRGQK
jgi:ABC-type uncharacterized transport system involved in gliding motility auxiliary subunit